MSDIDNSKQMAKTITADGETIAKIKVEVEVEIFLGEDCEDFTVQEVWKKIDNMERIDLGESVLNAMRIEDIKVDKEKTKNFEKIFAEEVAEKEKFNKENSIDVDVIDVDNWN